MRISTFFYSIGQGFKSLIRNKMYTLASVATIAACLFLFGLFYTIIADFQNVVKSAEEGVSVTVFFNEGVTEEQINQIKIGLEERSEVSKVVYVSAEEAWDTFKEDYLGEYADGFTENPFENEANLEIYLKDVSQQGTLVNYLEGLDEVRLVNRSEITATALSGVNKLIAYISVGIIVILFGVSIFLISNTVMMGISVRREEINIMKYIGATDFFVRAPFIIEGVIIGLAGSIVPLVIIYFIYGKAMTYFAERFSMISQLMNFLSVGEIFRTLVPVTMLLGVGIGFLGSGLTVRKHLRV